VSAATRLRETVRQEATFQADVAALASQWRVCLHAAPGSTQGDVRERPVIVFSSTEVLRGRFGVVTAPKSCKPEDVPFAEVRSPWLLLGCVPSLHRIVSYCS
jgi:hypothetical protein